MSDPRPTTRWDRFWFRHSRPLRMLRNRLQAGIDNFWARLAYRAGWRVDTDGWFYRRVRHDDRPATDFGCAQPIGQNSGNAFVGDETDVADVVPKGAYLFTRTGRMALTLDNGGMV